MKKIMGLAAIGLLAMAGAAMADPIFGVWKTQPDDGVFYHVQMEQCGAKICGRFIKKFENGAPVASDVIGKNAIFDMVNSGGGAYDGKAWKPSNNKVYKGKGSLSGNRLQMKGCVLGGLICLSNDWTKLD